MATSPSALTSSNTSGSGSPSSGDGSDFSPSRMAGAGDGGDGDSQSDPSAQSGSGNPSPALSQVTGQIREMETSLLSLASQFPNASGEVRRAVEGIRNVLKRIVSSPGAQEPAAPRG